MNTEFTAYDLSTGQVQFSGTSYEPADMASATLGVLLNVAHNGGWLDNGVHHLQPPAPTVHHTFDWNTKEWVDRRTLEGVKLLRRDYISRARLTANETSFSYQGKQIAVDRLSRGDIDAVHGTVVLTNEMPDDWVGGWKTVDNSYVAIPDKASWTLFYKAMVAQGTVNFVHSQALKAQVAAATTIEQVEAIVW